jgi:hypothetical protein
MLSTMSNSAFSFKYYKIVGGGGGGGEYTPFTYTTEGDQAKFVLLDDPNTYPIQFTGGACTGNITNLDDTSFINKNITLYFKSATTTGSGADFSALFTMSGATYTTTEVLGLYRNSSDATEMKLVVGSNATTYKNVNISGFSGIGSFSQVFVSIQNDDTMHVYMYDAGGSHINTQTITIDSSLFGTNYTKWSLNNKANDPSTGRPLIVDMTGMWGKTLTSQERLDWVDANKEIPYVQFTHDTINYTSGRSMPDGGNYRLIITSGACHAIINELTTSSLPNKNVPLYFKSMVTVNSDDGASLFMLSTGSSIYDNKGLLTMYRSGAAATSMNYVIGSRYNHGFPWVQPLQPCFLDDQGQ